MVTTNRDTSGKAYDLLKGSFERLKGVSITTNIKTNNRTASAGFGLIDSWEIVKSSRDKRRMVQIEVTLSEWFYNALLGKEVLSINRDYFRLRKTLERRLYELARKHCGYQKDWQIGLETLHEKSGSQSPLKYFRFQIRAIIEDNCRENHFPDYLISLAANDVVTFSRKDGGKENQPQGMLALDTMPSISAATLEKARRIVAEAGTGWDFHALHEQFTLSLIDGFQPKNSNGAFINFVKTKVATRP
jgi:hypothetical protein